VSAAYLDTSFLLAILFDEPGAAALQGLVARHDRVFAADLLVAETLATAAREQLDPPAVSSALRGISWVLPSRSLEREMREVLAGGYLRGADLWHVACAAFLAGAQRRELSFLSRDVAQRRVAKRLGFRTP
jgi:predicted nucleic acid-binding protein